MSVKVIAACCRIDPVRFMVMNRIWVHAVSRFDFVISLPPDFSFVLGPGSGSGGRSRFGLGVAMVIILLLVNAQASAHAALVSVRTVQGLEVQAIYDTGEPMVGAQVTVFEPDDPMRAQRLGLTDEQGFFRFVPGSEQPGLWSIQVRQAGHGAMTHFELPAGSDPVAVDAGPFHTAPVWLATATGTDPWQRLLMAVAIVWGFVGTALYFRSRQRPRAPS
jgi:nickel transport protein